MIQKRQAADFRKKHGIKTISSDELARALGEQGYTLIQYNGIEENEDVATLCNELNIEKWLKQTRCFTYRDSKFRIVFLQEGLTEEEKQIVLAHEEGHIWNDHLTKECVFGDDVIQEYEANEFTHFLLADNKGLAKRTKIIAIGIGLVLITAICLGTYLKNRHDEAIYTADFYRTESGSKYHLKDCIYIKNKTDVYRLTIDEYNSGKYEPCETCKPNERQ